MLLSEWSGNVVSARFRCGIPLKELAYESGVSETYLGKFLRKEDNQWEGSMRKIERGLRSCVEKRGIRFEDVFPTKT